MIGLKVICFAFFAITPAATTALASIELAKLNSSCAELGPTQPQLVAKLSPSSSFSWAELVLVPIPPAPGRPADEPASQRSTFKPQIAIIVKRTFVSSVIKSQKKIILDLIPLENDNFLF